MDVGFMRPLLVWRGYWIDEGYVMSEFKGTPGPWVVDLYGVDARWNIDATNGDSVAITNQLARDNDWAIRDANTRLIAAAPELLDALQELVHADCHGVRNSSAQVKALNKAMLAIDKALGR
ncbi:TPA: hypothetical protein ACGD7V_000870 [Serratia marcescens]